MKEKITKALGMLDDSLIEEAADADRISRNNSGWIKFALIPIGAAAAAAICVFAAGNIPDRGVSLVITQSTETDNSAADILTSTVNTADCAESAEIEEQRSNECTDAAAEFVWPVGGEDGGIITELMYGYGGYYAHKGIDIAAPSGTPVYAAESGKVVFADWYYGYGFCVMISHGDIKTVYGHLNEIYVFEGQQVDAGDTIAEVGSTGDTTGQHLHFEVLCEDDDGVNLNPMDYLPEHKSTF